ncbi:MAG: SMC-Scp complex subunit ScpB [Gammaproteobacteria bacterium]
MTQDTINIKSALEFALLTAGGAVDVRALKQMFGGKADARQIRAELANLREDWQHRSMELAETAGGFQFVSRPEYADYLRALAPVKPPRLSRQLMEVLSIIAYRQPATRGDIEKIRGVAVSSSQLAFLEECGWVEEVGRRETPGRPVLYSTTKTFLDDLGLLSLTDLPPEPEAPAEVAEEETAAGDDAEENMEGDGENAAPDNNDNNKDNDNV